VNYQCFLDARDRRHRWASWLYRIEICCAWPHPLHCNRTADRRGRANTICPGTIATPMNEGLDVSGFNPMKRKANPQEVAKLVVFLASDESPFISGADILIDGAELAG